MPFQVYKKKFIPPVMPLILSNPGSHETRHFQNLGRLFSTKTVSTYIYIYMGTIKHQQPHLYKLNDLIK